jgi:hypothetical protein
MRLISNSEAEYLKSMLLRGKQVTLLHWYRNAEKHRRVHASTLKMARKERHITFSQRTNKYKSQCRMNQSKGNFVAKNIL